MPVNDAYTSVVNFPMSKAGVNLHGNIVELKPEECILSQNCVWENGMVKRSGQTLVTSTQVVSFKKILGLHRFYMGDGSTKHTVAACDTTVKKFVSPATWTSIKTGLTTGLNTNFTTWGALNKIYACNGTDKMWSWDGTTATDITIADGIPTQALPYQDRLLTIIGGYLTWSPSFLDDGATWVAASETGVKPDTRLYGMSLHSVSNEASSNDTKVLLAGANGMYLFYGKDLRPIAGVDGDYSIFPISIPVGCVSPRTMCWTPMGTMWLGVDKQIYLLPFNDVSPVPVGTKIRSNFQGTKGIESIPDAQMVNAAAIYHDGYYKLSFASTNSSYNNVQYWADVKRGFKDDDGSFGPWYGPMTGQTISCFANMNGHGDSGNLLGGEASDYGYVYTLDDDGSYADIVPSTAASQSISVAYQTPYNPLGNANLRKDVHKIEAELLDVLGTVNVEFHDITGSLKTGDSFGLSGSAEYFNDNYWGDEYWSSSMPTRQVVDISPAIQPRRLSITIKHNSALDTFELYSLNAEVKEQAIVFA
jgi:hypothetical protein